jgi:hypothetical protein
MHTCTQLFCLVSMISLGACLSENTREPATGPAADLTTSGAPRLESASFQQTSMPPLKAPQPKLPKDQDGHPENVGPQFRRAEGYTAAAGANAGMHRNYAPSCDHGQCSVDVDCKAGQACLCRGGGGPGKCVAADCRADADCMDGQCTESVIKGPSNRCGENTIAFRCSSKQDECSPGRACDPAHVCMYDERGRRFRCLELCSG